VLQIDDYEGRVQRVEIGEECSIPRRSITRCMIASGMVTPFNSIEIPPSISLVSARPGG
jgi:hypothetical protein